MPTDTERLDWLLRQGCVVLNRDFIYPTLAAWRDEIDAEMAAMESEAK